MGFGQGGPLPLVAGGAIIGLGVAGMHYTGMAAMSMPDSARYSMPPVILSVVIAVVAGTEFPVSRHVSTSAGDVFGAAPAHRGGLTWSRPPRVGPGREDGR